MTANTYRRVCVLLCGLLMLSWPQAGGAQVIAEPSHPARQSLDDAWWTGPLLASGASTLPRGHVLIEPYLYDVVSRHSDSIGSRTYVLYGLTDDVTIGLIPVFGYNRLKGGPNGAGVGVGVGDVTLTGQYRLTRFTPGRRVPTISAVVQQTLPTGKHDRLGDRPADGLGGGAQVTTLALYSQTYLWMPNGRILRVRLNLAQTFSGRARLRDASVYGTTAGFRGHAAPGASFEVNAAAEYSLTRSWVLALDVIYGRNGATHVTGRDVSAPGAPRDVRFDLGASKGFGFAPAVEYSWTPRLGVIAGVRIIPAARNRTASVTPAMAVNMVF